MWSIPAVWKQYNKMAVLHFFLVNSTLIYILFSLVEKKINWSVSCHSELCALLVLILYTKQNTTYICTEYNYIDVAVVQSEIHIFRSVLRLGCTIYVKNYNSKFWAWKPDTGPLNKHRTVIFKIRTSKRLLL